MRWKMDRIFSITTKSIRMAIIAIFPTPLRMRTSIIIAIPGFTDLYWPIVRHGPARRPELIDRDPLGIYDWRTRITIENGVETERLPGIDTRQGPIQTINGGLTGYTMKKQLDADIIGSGTNNENVKIEFRYAEILLNYAEASLGLGQTDEATTYINMVRSRSAMPDFTGDVEEALRYERRIEFTFEGLRWLDVRRWKILDTALQDAIGINIEEITEDGVTTTTWKRALVQQRGPVTEKMYWVPIPREEINRAPQLTQNPGY